MFNFRLYLTKLQWRRVPHSVGAPPANASGRSVSDSVSSREDGFTLVEMLVVLAIIGLIVGLVGPRVLSYLSESKVKTARIQIEGFSSALDLYYLDNGRYPTSGDGLAALVQKPNNASSWNGPYLKSSVVPNDPWGRPYIYVSPGEHGAFDVMSLGPEGHAGTNGTAASIANWQR